MITAQFHLIQPHRYFLSLHSIFILPIRSCSPSCPLSITIHRQYLCALTRVSTPMLPNSVIRYDPELVPFVPTPIQPVLVLSGIANICVQRISTPIIPNPRHRVCCWDSSIRPSFTRYCYNPAQIASLLFLLDALEMGLIKKDLTTQNHWVCLIFPSSRILNTIKHIVSETVSLSFFIWGEKTHSVGSTNSMILSAI